MQIYTLSYNYNKDYSKLEILNNYYINDKIIYETVSITKEDLEALKYLLINDGFEFSHHYIYISKAKIKNYMYWKTINKISYNKKLVKRRNNNE